MRSMLDAGMRTFVQTPMAAKLRLPDDGITIADRPGHTEVLRIGRRDIDIVGYRRPNGRYTEALEDVLKPVYDRLGKDMLDTMRN